MRIQSPTLFPQHALWDSAGGPPITEALKARLSGTKYGITFHGERQVSIWIPYFLLRDKTLTRRASMYLRSRPISLRNTSSRTGTTCIRKTMGTAWFQVEDVALGPDAEVSSNPSLSQCGVLVGLRPS